jgi:hypothetical protein
MAGESKPAVAYFGTSSAAANVGADKDSDRRQRAVIEASERVGFALAPSSTNESDVRTRIFATFNLDLKRASLGYVRRHLPCL